MALCNLDSARGVDRSTVSELMHSTDEKCIFLMDSSECSDELNKSQEINAFQKIELTDIKSIASAAHNQKSSISVLHATDDIKTLDESKLCESNYGSKLSLTLNPFTDSEINTEPANVSSETYSNFTSASETLLTLDLNKDYSSENLNCRNTIHNVQSSSSLMPSLHGINTKASEVQKTNICGSSPQNVQVPTNRHDLPFPFDMSEFSSMSGSLEVELSDFELLGNTAKSDISSLPSNDASFRTDTPQDTFTSTYDHSELSFISGPYELDPNDLESQRLALGANIHNSSPQSCRCKTECYSFASTYDRPELSPISGSLDMDPSDLDSLGNARKSDRSSAASSRPLSATNELPLTELNLALFTSKLESNSSSIMSTNELPLSDIRFGKFRRQSTFDSQKDDLSLEVNWDTDVNKMDESLCRVARESRHRSFSDPNILDGSTGNVRWLSDKHFLLKKYNDSLFEQTRNQLPVPPSLACYPYSFYPEHVPEAGCPVCHYRGGGRAALGFPYPPPSLVVTTTTTTCMSSSADCGQAGGVSAPGVCGQGKRHRHSIAGQMSYFKMLGFGCGGPIGLKKLVGGSANSLFSTAVISGSSSAPNLRDMISNTSSATAIEGCGGVPSIRPLETLHNALSLRQLDSFLDRMTSAPLFRTPSSTPPKYPSTPLPTPNVSLTAKSQPLTPSNSLGWSGPPSLMSSSGPSSPGFSESISKGGSSSEMSSSVISGDGLNVDNLTKMFPTAPGLDQDLGNVGMLLDSFDRDSSSSALELSDYCSGIIQAQGKWRQW
ncbi:unnamed protein product [Callosobruchus maculatus]|nr:unnamed protein product [Callosobruchus maculatus]